MIRQPGRAVIARLSRRAVVFDTDGSDLSSLLKLLLGEEVTTLTVRLEKQGDLLRSVFAALDRYAIGLHSEAELERIILFCHQIAVAHLRFVSSGAGATRNCCINAEDFDAAGFSFIAKLFCKQGASALPLLASTWKRFSRDAEGDDYKALQHLVNLIRSVVLQQRVESIREARPQEWNIRRSLRHNLCNRRDIQLLKIGRNWIIALRGSEENDCPTMPFEEARRHLLIAISADDNMTGCVDKAVTLLHEQSGGYGSLLFDDLFRFILEYYASLLSTNKRSRFCSDAIPVSTLPDILLEPVLKEMEEKINHTYVRSAKISRAGATGYLRALHNYLFDLLECGDTDTHHSYLSDALPEMGAEEFNSSHKARFAYLVGEMREVLRSKAHFFFDIE